MANVSIRHCKPLSLSQRTQKGASTVEAILVIVPLLLLVFIVIEFTVMLHAYHTVVWAAEYAVREASGGMGCNNQRCSADELRGAEDDCKGDCDVQKKLSALTGNTITGETICIQYSKDGGSWDPGDENCTSSNPSGDYVRGNLVRVTIEATYKPMLPKLLVPDITFRSTFERSISIE